MGEYISAENDVVDWDEEQFDYITDASHNSKSDGAWLGYFSEF